MLKLKLHNIELYTRVRVLKKIENCDTYFETGRANKPAGV